MIHERIRDSGKTVDPYDREVENTQPVELKDPSMESEDK